MVLGIAIFFSKNAAPTAQAPADPALVLGTAYHALGPAAAPVTIVEFSDFQCPACKATQPLVEQVMAKYPEQVRLVYRHFPLSSIHPYAQLAAESAEVVAQLAEDETKFWEMHDLLFERQETWAAATSADAVRDIFSQYAQELGIDSAAFSERIGSEEIKQRVLSDVADASSLGLNSTPSLFVNNQPVTAPQLHAVVESILNKPD